jgi:hypothetical protein
MLSGQTPLRYFSSPEAQNGGTKLALIDLLYGSPYCFYFEAPIVQNWLTLLARPPTKGTVRNTCTLESVELMGCNCLIELLVLFSVLFSSLASSETHYYSTAWWQLWWRTVTILSLAFKKCIWFPRFVRALW